MRILKETERMYVNMECEWEDRELELLLNYAQDNIPNEVLDSMLISWAMEDIITKNLARLEEGTTEEDALDRLGVESTDDN